MCPNTAPIPNVDKPHDLVGQHLVPSIRVCHNSRKGSPLPSNYSSRHCAQRARASHGRPQKHAARSPDTSSGQTASSPQRTCISAALLLLPPCRAAPLGGFLAAEGNRVGRRIQRHAPQFPRRGPCLPVPFPWQARDALLPPAPAVGDSLDLGFRLQGLLLLSGIHSRNSGLARAARSGKIALDHS